MPATPCRWMVKDVVRHGVAIRICRTCALARELASLPLIPGTSIGTLPYLAQSALWGDKVITF